MNGSNRTNMILLALGITVVIACTVTAYALHGATQASHEAKRALCTLRHDDETRLKQTKAYLADNPDGIPGTGITGAILRQTVTGLTAQVAALKDVSC